MSTTPQRFTKRPVTIEAIKYDDNRHEADRIMTWIRNHGQPVRYFADGAISIGTLEGDMLAQPGDWIIRGVQGEFYPCKPYIFEATYEPAAEHHGEPNADSPTDAEVEAAARAILDAQIARGGALPEAVMRWEHKADARAALVAARKAAAR